MTRRTDCDIFLTKSLIRFIILTMRYDNLRKAERNKALVEYAENNPGLSLKEVGTVYGISGTRVWHILHPKTNNKKA